MRWIQFALVALLATAADAQTLKFTFIGNAAYEITDGETTLLIDYPYVSGANGYMEYDFEKTKPEGDVLCLITHNHQDHFSPALYSKTDWAIFAPHQVLRGLEKPRPISMGLEAQFKTITIQAFKTPHSRMVHHSYFVTWHGIRILVAGDTPMYGSFLGYRDLDVAFVTPWFIKGVTAAGQKIGADKVVICHHRADEKKPPCDWCIFPKQGDTFEVSLDGPY
jgi:L-ascorbate metabolism protein UlaG (beta-lactamase superfamily)